MGNKGRFRGTAALLRWALVCALSACGGGGHHHAPTLQSIAVTPDARAIAIGMTEQFTATGTLSDGSTTDLTPSAIWTSTPPGVAGVNSSGLASATAGGTATITATVGTVSGSAALSVAPPIPGNPTVWNFDNPANRLASFIGAATLDYRDPNATGWGPTQTTFAKASDLGLPLINGEDTEVMAFPATTPEQGYTLTHHSAPNGVFAADGYVSNYTLVMDLLLPADTSGTYRGLFQADEQNSNDAEMFVKNLSDGNLGVGVNAVYNHFGSMAPGTWHRVAIVVQCALGDGGTGQIAKYIDGLFVGGRNTPEQSLGDPRCRWALGPTFHLFTDNDGETAAGYVSSILYVDRLMNPDEIKALGGPHAAGAGVPGAAAPAPPEVASKRVLIFGHRAFSGRAPENSLAGMARAFDDGADHVECDIRKTSDNTLVLMHDPTVDRTTDGTGALDSFDLATLKTLDAGSWYDALFNGTRVPTLVEALGVSSGRGRLLLDVKLPGIAADIKNALDTAGAPETAVWVSHQQNDDVVAADFKAHLPNSGILWGVVPTDLSDQTFTDLKNKGAVGFDVDFSAVSQAFIDAAHANGMFIVVFTVLDPDTMLDMIALGVDGMETDYPAVLDSLMPPPLGP